MYLSVNVVCDNKNKNVTCILHRCIFVPLIHLQINIYRSLINQFILIKPKLYRVSQKTWEFSDELDIVFVIN